MTVTFPRTPAPRRATTAPRGRVRTRVGAAILASLAAIVLAAGPATAATPTPSPSSSAPSGVQTFTLAPVGNGIVNPGEGLSASVTLRNDTATATAPVTVTLALGDVALPDRSALSAWFDEQTGGGELRPVGAVELPAVESESEETRGIMVAAEDPSLAARAPGVYPLLASYEGPAGMVSSASAMIVPRATESPVGIGVVVPITAGALSSGLLSRSELVTLTAVDGSLTNQLNAVAGSAAILAVDPAIPAAIRVLGTTAPASAVAWLEELEALPNERFALQFGDADIAVQLQAGLSRPEQPMSLQAYMSAANFPPASSGDQSPSPTPTPTPTATTGSGPEYPSLTELLQIGDARAGVYWPATGTAGSAVVTALGGIQTEDVPSLTMIPSASTAAGQNHATVGARAAAADAGLLVYDADVSAALQTASLNDQNTLRGASLTAATAYLSYAVAESAGRPLLVTLDRGVDRSQVSLGTAIRTATQAPGVSPIGLDAIAEAAPQSVEVTDAAPDEARIAAASALFADEAALARFATVLDTPTLLTGPERATILQLLGDGWLGAAAAADPTAWPLAITDHELGTEETLDAVGILPPSTIQLISAGADLPVWVRNELPYPITVVLYASPDDLRLEVQSQVEVAVAPSSNTKVEVPVQARVGSGEVTVALQLRSRTSEPIGATQYAEVNVRADWEGIGLVAMAVIVFGLLTFGLVRTFLRRRSASATAAAPATEDDADAAATDSEEGTR